MFLCRLLKECPWQKKLLFLSNENPALFIVNYLVENFDVVPNLKSGRVDFSLFKWTLVMLRMIIVLKNGL